MQKSDTLDNIYNRKKLRVELIVIYREKRLKKNRYCFFFEIHFPLCNWA